MVKRPTCDVAIIGAGPYGLSAAAHLRAVNGLEIRIFGDPMSFWKRQMPVGMRLRSSRVASNLSDPDRALTLEAYQSASGNPVPAKIPLERFIDYGLWFQRQVADDVDRRTIKRLERGAGGFRLVIEDGEELEARRVIVAAGISAFASRPSVFEGLSPDLVSHSSEHRNFEKFSHRRVIVAGGGQSALESAALLHEIKADVEVVMQEPVVNWLWKKSWLHIFKAVSRIMYAAPDVGPAFVSHLIAAPNLFRRLPRQLQDWLEVRSIRPASAAWLKPRLEDVLITTGRTIVTAVPAGDRLKITLDDGSRRDVDHLLLATGYRVDISRYSFLSEDILASIKQINGYPKLREGFETSVPGLHFLGAPAAWSFGPLLRFVAGTEFAARALTRRILEKPPTATSLGFLRLRSVLMS